MNTLRLRFEPIITTLFRSWWRISRPVTLGVRAAACDEHGRVMLVRHSYLRGWHLPGGGVEHRESAAEAIKREMREEAGIDADAPPVLAALYWNHANFKNDHIALYRFESWRPCAPRPGEEIAERGFFALDALPEGTTPATRRRLNELFAGAPLSETW